MKDCYIIMKQERGGTKAEPYYVFLQEKAAIRFVNKWTEEQGDFQFWIEECELVEGY